MIEYDPALDSFDTAAQLHREGDALAEREDFGTLRMRHRARGNHNLGYAIEKVRRHLIANPADHGLEIGKAHDGC
jgi:hypothetical protein